ncbi:MAG: NAD(P)H-dependent oxidoreductase subunit E [candidate division KSB1 bacterium]|jgi:NADH-quinone oxidoreductase subunit E|nr:NAD(P)H-dependent oxidoreductase subunit E [candidate division KSB1 bacterium]
MHAELLEEIINDHGDQRSDLITVLHEVQSNYNYLPEDALRYLSERMSIPLIDIYSIASFYKSFSLTPRGKHLCSVCMGTACHVRGAVRVLGEVERKLGIQPDETTEDKQFSLQTVNCLGACALGPIVVIDNDYHRNTTPQKINTILEAYKTVLDAD